MSTSSPLLDSPCTKVCRIEPASGFCVGCGRDLDEIAGWAGLDAPERRRVLGLLPARLAAFGPRPS